MQKKILKMKKAKHTFLFFAFCKTKIFLCIFFFEGFAYFLLFYLTFSFIGKFLLIFISKALIFSFYWFFLKNIFNVSNTFIL